MLYIMRGALLQWLFALSTVATAAIAPDAAAITAVAADALATIRSLHQHGLLTDAVLEAQQHAILALLLPGPAAAPPATLCRVNCTRVDVTDFGAVGDGVQDDAPAFQVRAASQLSAPHAARSLCATRNDGLCMQAGMAAVGTGGLFYMPCGRFKLVHNTSAGDKPCGPPNHGTCFSGCAGVAHPNVITMPVGKPNIEVKGEGLCTRLDIHSDANPRVFSAYNSGSWGLTFRDFSIDETHAQPVLLYFWARRHFYHCLPQSRVLDWCALAEQPRWRALPEAVTDSKCPLHQHHEHSRAGGPTVGYDCE